jgi:hypothetical protein
VQRQLAAAMLAADAPGLHVYYVDDHFVPYEGAKPVPKGWNTKRRHAQPGCADTVVSDYQGRAVCFATGDPSGLAATLPGALAQLRQVLGGDAPVLFGFDRGGSYPVAFRAIRERELAAVVTSAQLSAAAKNTAIPAAQKKITRTRDAVTAATAALKPIPARLPASQITPGAQKAILATRRRSLQMVLRLLAASAEHCLATRLNDYLRDPDEYRAITRHLLHLGGQITCAPAAITVTLDVPAPPRLARALALLLDEINATPPRMPGGRRPITYQLAGQPART